MRTLAAFSSWILKKIAYQNLKKNSISVFSFFTIFQRFWFSAGVRYLFCNKLPLKFVFSIQKVYLKDHTITLYVKNRDIYLKGLRVTLYFKNAICYKE